MTRYETLTHIICTSLLPSMVHFAPVVQLRDGGRLTRFTPCIQGWEFGKDHANRTAASCLELHQAFGAGSEGRVLFWHSRY
jgi:hypothetical protein